jgi:hypothetical protein
MIRCLQTTNSICVYFVYMLLVTYFRWSVAFEMKDPRERVEVRRLLYALLKYIRSGEARISTLQVAL